MTTPNQPPIDGAFVLGGRYGQDITEQSALATMRGNKLKGFEGAQTGFNGPGGFLGRIISAITQGAFFNLGGLSSWMGNLFGTVDRVVNVEVPRLDNRIDEVSVGGVSAQRAFFGNDGTWTKPTGFSRHVVDAIGGGSGGGRSNAQTTGNGTGGYAGGWNQVEFFDGDLPATVAITIGVGGAGATADNRPGAPGGNTLFGSYLAGFGALAANFGAGNKTIQIRGGNGGAAFSGVTIPASAGTGHSYGNGGAAGVGAGGAAGGDGNSPIPATMPYPGTGGGGGARRAGIGNGGNGGNGGYPGAPGGGGGAYESFGTAGNGGNGAPGACWVTSYK